LLQVLCENGVIPEEQPAINMASFRNMLVLQYDKIDDEVVFGIFKKRLSDFLLFINLIEDWCTQEI